MANCKAGSSWGHPSVRRRLRALPARSARLHLADRPSLLGGGRFVGFGNYFRIWRDAGFWRALQFTVVYTLVLTPILMSLGYALALLTLDNTPLKRLTRTIVFIPVIIGLASSSLLWFWLLDEQVGLFNKLLVDLHLIKEPIVWFVTADLAFWAVVISITWKVVGFGMVLFVSGIQAIPTDIIEAAIIDGAATGAGFAASFFRSPGGSCC